METLSEQTSWGLVHTLQDGRFLVDIMVLFAPGMFSCTWKEVQEKTIWGTFLLLGGAITKTAAMTKSGLAGWLALHIHEFVVGMSWWQIILVMTGGTQIIRIGMLSNVAAIAIPAPIVVNQLSKLTRFQRPNLPPLKQKNITSFSGVSNFHFLFL